jgi:hypothetical protein
MHSSTFSAESLTSFSSINCGIISLSLTSMCLPSQTLRLRISAARSLRSNRSSLKKKAINFRNLEASYFSAIICGTLCCHILSFICCISLKLHFTSYSGSTLVLYVSLCLFPFKCVFLAVSSLKSQSQSLQRNFAGFLPVAGTISIYSEPTTSFSLACSYSDFGLCFF